MKTRNQETSESNSQGYSRRTLGVLGALTAVLSVALTIGFNYGIRAIENAIDRGLNSRKIPGTLLTLTEDAKTPQSLALAQATAGKWRQESLYFPSPGIDYTSLQSLGPQTDGKNILPNYEGSQEGF